MKPGVRTAPTCGTETPALAFGASTPHVTSVLARSPSRHVRIASFLLLLCLSFMTAETLIADTCDGDSRATTATVIDGDDTSAPVELPDGGTVPSEHHSAHIDHCVHPHAGGPIARGAASIAPVVHVALVRAESEREPVSATLEPHFRPPVA